MNDIIEERHRQYIEKINELRIIDDDFMKVVFKDEDCIRHVIQTVLQVLFRTFSTPVKRNLFDPALQVFFQYNRKLFDLNFLFKNASNE